MKSGTSRRSVAVLLCAPLLLLFTAILAGQGTGAPSIQVCGGGQTVCLDTRVINLCVTVTVDPGYPEKIDSFEINWDDGSAIATFAGRNTSFNVEHRYDFGGFFESCLYQSDRKFVSLATYVNGETRPIESIFPLTALNPPKAEFDDFPATVCVNESVYIADKSCPSELLTTYDFGDGSPTSEYPYHTYGATGSYTVTLTVENDCGVDRATRTVNVIEQPIAVALPDSGIIAGYDDPYRICLDGTATIRADARGSVGLDRRQWTVSPDLGVRIAGAGSNVSRISFTEPGEYLVRFGGQNNNCATEARDSFYVEVVESTVLRLDRQPDVCEAFAYCPTPSVAGATYTLNGNPLAGCSAVLGEGTYVVEAFLANALCGDATLRDTFVVSAQATAVIAQTDTVVCDRDAPVRLTAAPAGGVWTIDGQAFDGTVDPGSWPPGTYRVAYGDEPCLVADAIRVEILGSAVTVPDDGAVCLDAGTVRYTASPAGGRFTGPGIDSAGLFDPAVAGLGTHTLTYAWEDEQVAGCGGGNSFTVTVSDLSVDFAPVSCSGSEVCLAVDDPAAYTSVRWDFGDGQGGSGPEVCHDYARPGTYEVTVTAGRGPCTATFSRSVSIAPAPVAGFTLAYDPDRCSDLSVSVRNTSTGTDLTYAWLLNDTLISDSTELRDLLLVSRTRDTTYTLALEVSNGCSTSRTEERITVRPLPTSDFGTDQDRYCSGDTVLLSNNAVGDPFAYEWSLDGRIIGNDSLPPLIVHETEATDTLEVCLTTYNDCGATTTCRPIVVTPTSVSAFFNVSPTVICIDDTVRLTNFATPGVDVRYDFGDGNGSSLPDATVVYGRAGDYTIEQRAFGCGSDVFRKTVSVRPRPTANFEAPVVICAGAPAGFTNLSGDTLRASWDFGDGSPPSPEYSPTHRFDSAGTYTVCLTVTSLAPDGCDHTVCTTVEVSPLPAPGFAYTDSLCLGGVLDIRSTSPVAGGTCTYRFGDGTSATDCTPAHTYAAAGTYRITQVVTDRRGCRDSISRPVFVRDVPDVAPAAVEDEVCFPDSVSFRHLSRGGESYRWDFGDGSISTAADPAHAFATPGTYAVSLEVADRFCRTEGTVAVTVHEKPAAVIEVSDTASCFGSPLVFADRSTGPVAGRSWDFGDGTVAFGTEGSHPFPAPGDYLTRLRVTTAAGCTDSTALPIVIHEPVEGLLQETGVIRCYDDATGAVTFVPTRGADPFAYAWSDGGVTEAVDRRTAGTYALTVTDANGCELTDSITLTQPDPVDPGPTATTVTCAGGSDGALSLAVSGGTAPYELRWVDGTRETARIDLPAGDYGLLVDDANGCRDSFVLTVPENPPLDIVDSLTGISCFGAADAALDLLDIGGGVGPYVVTLTGNRYRESGTTLTRFDPLAPGVYTLEVADALGCLDERDIIVAEPDRVNLDILQDSVFLELGDTVSLLTRYNAAEPVFRWDPPPGLSCVDCPAPVARPYYPQSYTAQVTDRRGCSARDSVYVHVDIHRDIYLPNTFTPNGDGRNDIFRVRTNYPAAIAEVVRFEVRDRWGALLHLRNGFPPNDPAFGWDGMFNDAPVSTGQYVYQVQVRYVDGFEKTVSGSILILR